MSAVKTGVFLWRMAGHLPCPGEDCSDSSAHKGVPELGRTGQSLARLSRQLAGSEGSLQMHSFFWMRGILRWVKKGGAFTVC